MGGILINGEFFKVRMWFQYRTTSGKRLADRNGIRNVQMLLGVDMFCGECYIESLGAHLGFLFGRFVFLSTLSDPWGGIPLAPKLFVADRCAAYSPPINANTPKFATGLDEPALIL